MRHIFGLQAQLPTPAPPQLASALLAEQGGNWWIAASSFAAFAKSLRNDPELQARLLTRAAGCYEAAVAFREAAHTYAAVAMAVRQVATINPQVMAELHLMASFCHRQISASFGVASQLHQAAHAFEIIGKASVRIEDTIPPLPTAAGGFTFAGECYRHAAEISLQSSDLKSASFYFWLAGNMHVKQGHGYHGANSYRQAIALCGRRGESLDPESLRRLMPLTPQERDSKTDIIQQIEDASRAGYVDHKRMNPQFPKNFVEQSTDEFMISTLELLSRELSTAGNRDESIRLGALAAERRRKRYVRNKKWLHALVYGFWNISSRYGTDYRRWFATLTVVASLYAWVYWTFKLIQPLRNFADPFYFSMVTMTTVGYGDILPVGNCGKLVACSEIVFGLAMFGVLVGIISGRVIRS